MHALTDTGDPEPDLTISQKAVQSIGLRGKRAEKFSLLFTGNIPRGVFCEQSSQKTRELRREIMRMHDFCASRSVLLVTE